jgi:hypothetical protein
VSRPQAQRQDAASAACSIWYGALQEGGCGLEHLRVFRVGVLLRVIARVVQAVGTVVRHVVRKHVVLTAHGAYRTRIRIPLAVITCG